MAYRILTRDEHFTAPGPKRILTLDGGGLKGIVTLGFLARVESLLRERHGNDAGFRLAHYFDLIAGTSTGAIIAAALAKGMTVAEVTAYYLQMGTKVFKSSWFRHGAVLARYDDDRLRDLLKEVLGEATTLGDASLLTGVMFVTKRVDTGSPWPLGNNPRGRYFGTPADRHYVGNGDYPLWQVVRASTAAPTFFDPESFTITEACSDRQAVHGTFVDGGVSPFNNPSLQAFMYATLAGYRVQWPKGADNLLVCSVGTGMVDPARAPAKIAAAGAVQALMSLMDDCASLVETMMQWMAGGTKVKTIDRELGDLRGDLLTSTPLFTYSRYDVSFTADCVNALVPGLSAKQIASLSEMDETDNLQVWKSIGEKAAETTVEAADFPPQFNLPEA
ncbi:MAG: patatin-like phospholipase family protein [Gammaproteobacteria bacterium]|nr:patatin-like phospholipase family protein [Gammaproteobacteria bacterium]